MTCIGLHEITSSKSEIPPVNMNLEATLSTGTAYARYPSPTVTGANIRFSYSGPDSMFFYQPAWQARRSDLKDELDELYKECSARNWDGYDARPIDKSLRPTVERFVNALPDHISTPEISADPDGEISLEWFLGDERFFSISIGKNKRLSYAGICGPKKFDGIDFFGGNIPEAILIHIHNILK